MFRPRNPLGQIYMGQVKLGRTEFAFMKHMSILVLICLSIAIIKECHKWERFREKFDN